MAAEQGHAQAQFLLGLYYASGLGIGKDEAEAVKWYRNAAEQGHAGAQSSLGVAYAYGQGVEKDDFEAVKWYRNAAEQGGAGAQCSLGFAYANGKGVDKNEVEAVKWYRKAAEQGFAQAQFNLGVAYANGQGVKQDHAEAVKWYRKAAEQGHAGAQGAIADSYAFGRGVKQDQLEAVEWYRKAADQGRAGSQFVLGSRYANGLGVKKDYAEAVKWYRKAAEQGDAQAQFSLGAAYANGQGVVKNDTEAYKWILLAASKGNELASKNVLAIESRLTPAQRAEGQRMAQEWEARFANREKSDEASVGRADEPAEAGPKSMGTGFLVTRDGYLVTSQHVINDCKKVFVRSEAGLLEAVVVREDAATDLALLKVTGEFHALPVVSSRVIRLGAAVATIGFPNIGLQGIEPKLSKGDVSSLAGMQDDVKYFQISVPVQPGNSGGPLFDMHGNVVGVIASQLSQKAALESTGTLAQSVNYAVKSSYLLGFLESVPEANSGIPDALTDARKFEAVVSDVKKATVLIIGY